MQYQFVRKKLTVHLAIPNSDTLVDAFVTVYAIHMDHGSSKFLQNSLNCSSNLCRTVWGLEFLRNVIFLRCITFQQINTFFLNIVFFLIGKCVWGWNQLRRPFIPNSYFASMLPTNGLGRSALTDFVPARVKP